MMRIALAVLLALPVLAALDAPSGARPAVIPLKLPSGKVLQSEVMVKDEDRQMGLMFRPSLPIDRGMLFAFDTPDFHRIWMKNCKFPIDIVWLDEDHEVVDVAENTPPCPPKLGDKCPSYAPLAKASYVIEMNAGQARREGVVRGAIVDFALP